MIHCCDGAYQNTFGSRKLVGSIEGSFNGLSTGLFSVRRPSPSPIGAEGYILGLGTCWNDRAVLWVRTGRYIVHAVDSNHRRVTRRAKAATVRSCPPRRCLRRCE